MTRKEAILRGLTRYFTGKPCKHGHIAARHVTNHACSECARKNSEEFKRKRRKEYPEERSLEGARRRCNAPQSHDFSYYGGRGIQCKIRDVHHLIELIGRRPSPDHSLDRYPDKDGHYEEGNIRWATPREQANNRRSKIQP